MKDEILTDHLYFLSTCKELYNRAKSGYTDCPRVVVWTSENDIARAGERKTSKNIEKYCIFIFQRNLHEIFDTIL